MFLLKALSMIGSHATILLRPAAVIDALRTSIVGRTGTQVRDLSIEMAGGKFLVRGRVVSFYVHQLVLAARQSVLGEAFPYCLECRLEVSAPLAAAIELRRQGAPAVSTEWSEHPFGPIAPDPDRHAIHVSPE